MVVGLKSLLQLQLLPDVVVAGVAQQLGPRPKPSPKGVAVAVAVVAQQRLRQRRPPLRRHRRRRRRHRPRPPDTDPSARRASQKVDLSHTTCAQWRGATLTLSLHFSKQQQETSAR